MTSSEKIKKKKHFGYVSIYRAIIDSSIFYDDFCFRVYLYCVMRANFEDKKVVRGNQVIPLKRGQFISSYGGMLADLNGENKKKSGGHSIKQIRGKIEQLKRANKIEWKGQTKFSIITVNNYDYWQSQGQAEYNKKDKGKGQTEGIQRATDNNYNNYNKKKKDFSRLKIKDYLQPEQKKCFDEKHEFVKMKLIHPANENRILVWLYLMESRKMESEIELNVQLKKDRADYAQELSQISKLNDNDIMPIMANMSKNKRLSLANVAMACKLRNGKNKANIDKLSNVKSNLINNMGL